ncbi:MAG: enoyl-CoA hydratase/isomerase family protein [Chloroflexi bacterium]|nr:enoyl-CoA hydratase/isomerase family protein [Chloroflexota bacterium]
MPRARKDRPMGYEHFETIEVVVNEQGVATLTLNRPDRLNAVNLKMMMELREAFRLLDADLTAKVIVVRANGRAFCAGADLEWSAELGVEGRVDSNRLGQRTFNAMEQMETPIIAAVHGYCLGGGLEFALAADFILCSSNAQLGLPEITLSADPPVRPKITEDGDPDQPEFGGQAPGWGAPKRLPARVGKAMALQMVLTGERVDAEKALRIGLANEVYAEDEFETRVMEMADRIAHMNRYNLRLNKELLQAGYDMLEPHPR